MHIVLLGVLAGLFGLFTCCMLCDQISVVTTNTTSIDRMKGEVHEMNIKDIDEVFGGERGKFRLHWLLPIPANFKSSENDVLGFRNYVPLADDHMEEIQLLEAMDDIV